MVFAAPILLGLAFLQDAARAEPSLLVVDAEVTSSLSGALANKPDGPTLAALVGRLFMWRVDLRKEIERGDRVRVVYFRDAQGELVIAAARYRSMRKGAVFDAFRFKAAGDAAASYWDGQGVEVPERLREGPLRSYDQITALLKDRPTHKGMDFKAPVGTPVYAHRAGTINRVNWRRAGNGNCLEIRFHDGTVAKYLHLSAVRGRPGQPVRPGQQVAETGNTGRSTAPHLHYQLQRGQRTIDPLDYHGTFRRTLPPADREAFARAMKRLAPRLE
jgi:murein DD-endopeptidase MepM/ murein hydrolase activator NlpD